MNFAECTRESSSSEGWNRWDEAEDEENAKHIVGVVEKRSNDDDKRRRKWKLLWKKNRRRRRRFCPRGDKGVVVFAISRFARRRLFVVMWFFVRWKIYFILCVFASLRERERKMVNEHSKKEDEKNSFFRCVPKIQERNYSLLSFFWHQFGSIFCPFDIWIG